MAEPDDPGRLWQRRDLSPNLSHALRALRSGPDDSARLARVSSGLGVLLDQGHEPTSRIVRRVELRGRRGSVRPWLAGGLVLLAPMMWLARGGWPLGAEPEPAPLAAASTGRPLSAASVPAPAAQARVDWEPSPPSTANVAPLDAPPAQLAPAARRAGGKSRARSHRRSSTAPVRRELASGSGADQSASERTASAPLTAADATASSGPEPESAAEVATLPTVALEEPVRAVAQAPAPRPERVTAVESGPSESDLLLAARGMLRVDPERALLLVTQHEARFPRGALVPEREVLAIEVLRSLGQHAAARARLARFAERYPHSFYLEGLQR